MFLQDELFQYFFVPNMNITTTYLDSTTGHNDPILTVEDKIDKLLEGNFINMDYLCNHVILL